MTDIAIEVQDVSIHYRILSSVSVQGSFLRRKTRSDVVEAVRHVSFAVEEGGILGIVGKTGAGSRRCCAPWQACFRPIQG